MCYCKVDRSHKSFVQADETQEEEVGVKGSPTADKERRVRCISDSHSRNRRMTKRRSTSKRKMRKGSL